MASESPHCPEIGALAARLRGHRLPGGTYRIRAVESRVVGRLNGLEHPQPHPVFAAVASLRALGVTIEELCALCEFRLADGPMLGEFTASYLARLAADVPYSTSATIDSLDRTGSRRFGVLDRLRFTVNIDAPDGSPVAVVRYLWLLPRGRVER